MPVEITIEDDRWDGLGRFADTALTTVSGHLGFEDLTISVLGCDDARIATLNAEFRGKPAPTNVLSWPAETLHAGDTPRDTEIGDIAIAYDTCVREATEQGKPFDHHATHLMIHAVLHLLGYDHETGADAAQMEGLETVLLANLGIDDPYEDQGA